MKFFSSMMIYLLMISCVEQTIVESKNLESDKKTQDNSTAPSNLSGCSNKAKLTRKNLQDFVASKKGVEIVAGKIEHIIIDGVDNNFHKTDYVLTTNSGDEVKIPQDYPEVKATVPNSQISIAVTRRGDELVPYRDGNQGLISFNQGCETTNRDMRSRNQNTQKNIVVGVFMPGENKHKTAVDAAEKVQAYYAAVTNGNWNITAIGYGVPIEEEESLSAAVRRFKQENQINVTHTAYFYNGSGGPSPQGKRVCGYAYIGGTYSTNYCRISTLLHELGHNFGLHHASSTSREYGDETSIMGTQSTRHLNSPQMLLLGFDYKNRELTQTEKVYLMPIEGDLSELIEGTDQIIKVRDKFISLRTLSSIRPYGLTRSSHRVQVHTGRSLSGSSRGTTRHANLREGQSTSVDDIKVDFVQMHGELAEVNIYYNINDNTPGDKVLPVNNGGECNGETPLYADACDGDLLNLSGSLSIQAVDNCSSSRKCEYKCAAGYIASADGQSCQLSVAGCEGGAPQNAELCTLDDFSVQPGTNILAVSQCSEARKCEFKCNETFQPSADGLSCEPGPNECVGEADLAEHAILCPGDEKDLEDHTPAAFRESCSNSMKCEYVCAPGYKYNRGLLGIGIPPSCERDPDFVASCTVESYTSFDSTETVDLATGQTTTRNTQGSQQTQSCPMGEVGQILVRNFLSQTVECDQGELIVMSENEVSEIVSNSCQVPASCRLTSYTSLDESQEIIVNHGDSGSIFSQGQAVDQNCSEGQSGTIQVREFNESIYECNNGNAILVDEIPRQEILMNSCQQQGGTQQPNDCSEISYKSLSDSLSVSIPHGQTRNINTKGFQQSLACPGDQVGSIIQRVYQETPVTCMNGNTTAGVSTQSIQIVSNTCREEEKTCTYFDYKNFGETFDVYTMKAGETRTRRLQWRRVRRNCRNTTAGYRIYGVFDLQTIGCTGDTGALVGDGLFEVSKNGQQEVLIEDNCLLDPLTNFQ